MLTSLPRVSDGRVSLFAPLTNAFPNTRATTMNDPIETEIARYAASYGCTLEEARRDVEREYAATDTDTDAFYERSELPDHNEVWDLQASRNEYRE